MLVDKVCVLWFQYLQCEGGGDKIKVNCVVEDYMLVVSVLIEQCCQWIVKD